MSNYNRGRRPDDWTHIVEDVLNTITDVVGEAVNTFNDATAGKDFTNNIHLKTKKEEPENNLNKYKKKKAKYICGYIFASLSCFSAFINAVKMLVCFFVGKSIIGYAAASLVLLAASVLLFVYSASESKFQESCVKYNSVIGTKPEVSLAYIESTVHKKRKQITKDIEKLIKKGILPSNAYIDSKNNILILDSYYKEEKEEEPVKSDDYTEWLIKIRELNLDIQDEEVSDRVYKLEDYSKKIFDYVKTHPEAKAKIRTFLNYYLPTTVKLLDSYNMIEEVGVAGENMKETKKSIEKTLDALCIAYRCQLDALYSVEAMDISSDIEVLETMLRRDGFAEKDSK